MNSLIPPVWNHPATVHTFHSWEGLLATVFTFKVYLFSTHLRPGAFPMDKVIFTGRVTEEQFKEERFLELQMLSDTEYKKRLMEPLPRWQKRLAYITGHTFPANGFFLLIVIIIGTFF